MKKLLLLSSVIIAAFGCDSKKDSEKSETAVSADTATLVASTNETKPAETPAVPMDSAAMMKAWQEYMTPGKEHAMLASHSGTWKEEMTVWMSEGAPAQKNTATCTNKMIMNGLYQQSVHKGNFDGMPFEGISTVGFDNAKKKFVSSWIDNMGTGIMNTEGTYDSTTKILTMRGTCVDPMTKKTYDLRETLTMVDDKTQLMEMYEIKDGKERKSMEIKMTKM